MRGLPPLRLDASEEDMGKTALVTGVTGQDGAYLAKFLLDKGYKVYGAARRTSSNEFWRLRQLGIYRDVEIAPLEHPEESNVAQLIAQLQVDELYNLAAQSFVGTSFQQPIYTTEIDAVGACRILEAIRRSSRHTHFYQASTSEMFGKAVRRRNVRAPHSIRALRCRQAVCPLDHRELPRSVQPFYLLGHPVQSRIAAAGPGVRDQKNHDRLGRNPPRPAGCSQTWQFGRAAGLGIRRGLRCRHVDDAECSETR